MAYTYQPAEPDELRELRASVRACLDRYSPVERVRTVSAGDGFDADLWARLNRDFGLAGFTAPVEYGGQGFGPVEHGVVLEELGRGLACVPVFASAVLAAGILEYAGDPTARADLWPELATGETVATVAVLDGPVPVRATPATPVASPATPVASPATSPPTPGTPVASPPTPATPDATASDGWTLDGSVAQVLSGDRADLVLVRAATGPDTAGFFAVRAGAPGMTVTARPAFDQTRPLSTMDFIGTPARAVGAIDAAPAVLARLRPRARAALAAEQLGAAARLVELATDHAATRSQFGALIGSFQAVKHACATMFAGVHLTRGVTYAALARAGSTGPRAAELAAAAVVATGDVFAAAAAATVQLHGAMGFSWEHPAHLYLKRATASSALLWGAAAARVDLERALLPA